MSEEQAQREYEAEYEQLRSENEDLREQNTRLRNSLRDCRARQDRGMTRRQYELEYDRIDYPDDDR